jgi:iron complex transport system substrate-binding protein
MALIINPFRLLPFVGFFLLLCLHSNGAEIRYAKNLTVETHEGYNVVTVRNTYKSGGTRQFQYVLLSPDTNIPEGYPEAIVVNVPVKRVISLSTTFLGLIDQLDEVDSLVGIGSFQYTNTPSVVEKIGKGELVDVGSKSSKNIELIVSLAPDVVFTNAIGNPDYDIHPVLDEMGITSGLTAAYLEETLLGRAEWVKFVGAFYNKLELAEKIFSQTEVDYNALLSLTIGIQERPTVFANPPWGNVWYTPSGISFIANAIRDAGGTYVWADDRSTGSIPLDFETVYERVIDAQFWINTGYLDSMSVLLSNDARYGDFRAVKEGNVYCENNRLNEYGGNDIWERGFTHPQEILADLIKIFHPDLIPEHEFVFYRKLE